MLLTVPLLSKGSFLGSLINKCRQVVRIKPVNKLETNIKPNTSTSITTLINSAPTPPASSATSDQKINRPAAVANFSLSRHLNAAKTIEEKAGLPQKPRKPLTPYFRYMNEERPKLQAANPKISLPQIVKQISKEWVHVDASVKQRLQEEYKKEHQTYIQIRAKYDANITDEQRLKLKELKQEKNDAKDKRMMRRRIKELGRPKKPASAFLRFAARQRALLPQLPTETFSEWQRKAAAKWAALSQEEKDVYMVEARKELDKYKTDISQWEEKMIRLGHIDVIRNTNLIDPPEPKPKKH